MITVKEDGFGVPGSNPGQDFAFHYVLMSLGKAWIYLFFFHQP